MTKTAYETVIGLEVHLQLSTKTKVFCGCGTTFGQKPNSQTCPVCLGLPGSLPVLNGEAFRRGIMVALALGCRIQETVKFDRKNYYYPDLPKNFQISQFDMPLSYDGKVVIDCGAPKTIRVKRVHLEEDAGKLIHPEGEGYSLVDYNRTGLPLLEIVTEPDISSPEEAYAYLTILKSTLGYLRVSDCDMEKGSLRCDANISLRPVGQKELGVKVEIKNLNSFKGVRGALEHEAKRQAAVLEDGGSIVQETRLWNSDKDITTSMRTKEEAKDYRYFPEPDLVPFVVESSVVEEVRRSIPELPAVRAPRFQEEFGLSAYDALVLTGQIDVAEFFEETARISPDPKKAANWIMGDILAHMNDRAIGIREVGLSPAALAGLIKLVEGGTLSGKMAKEVLAEAIETKRDPSAIVSERGLSQISDAGAIEQAVEDALARNAKSVADYQSGKKNALGFLVGQVMKDTKGKANPGLVNEILRKKLGD